MNDSASGKRPRIVIAGFGDTGLLVGIHLASQGDVVGISPKPCLVSGQELGVRLTRPAAWKREYLMSFRRYSKLDGVRTLHGHVSRIDTAAREVSVRLADGSERREPWDVLVIASGVTNGFWRNAALEHEAQIQEGIDDAARRIAAADVLAIVGGGATGVSVAANVAGLHPEKSVHLFHSGARPLPGYHPKTRSHLESHLGSVGVRLHPEHRALLPDDFDCGRMTSGPLTWSTGQAPFDADLVLWAVGRVKPNNDFIPADMLDTDGFVKVDDRLRVPGHEGVFAVGDIAASDPHRSSARNWGYRLLAHNVRAHLRGDDDAMKRYSAPEHRWGSILGVQSNGLQVFQPGGGRIRFPKWAVDRLLFPLAVHRGIYKGVRRAAPASRLL